MSENFQADFDPARLPDAFYDDPFPTYHDLRDNAPVYRCPDGALFLTRYADVVAVYRDPGSFSSDKQREFKPKYGDSPLFEHHTTSLVFNDQPLHTRVRKLIAGAFKPRTVNNLQPSIEALVDRLLDACATRNRVDAITDFAMQIPVEVIGNMLRVPHSDRGPLRDWSLAILGALEAATSPDVLERGNAAVREFSAYLDDLIEDRRAALSTDRDDMLSTLIRGETNGERLTHRELVHNCIFILNAGHETTTNLIGSGINTLLNHPDALAQLQNSPELIDTAVEEFLRFESPNQLGNRITTQAAEIGGNVIEPGTRIWLCIGAANRDPAEFDQPDVLDLRRSPNRHVAFAAGVHTCVGLNVARMEARIALSRLLTRFPGLSRAGTPRHARRARFRGLETLPVTLVNE